MRSSDYIPAMGSISRWFLLGTFLVPLSAVAAGPRVGERVPTFTLETLKGKKVTAQTLQGRPTVMVVARTRASANDCKGWIDAVEQHWGKQVAYYQVIVALKPWFMPEFAVRSKVQKLVPNRYHRRVLLEWRDRFARQFNIPKDDQPTILVLDGQGVLRWKHRGKLTDKALRRLAAALPVRELSVVWRRTH